MKLDATCRLREITAAKLSLATLTSDLKRIYQYQQQVLTSLKGDHNPQVVKLAAKAETLSTFVDDLLTAISKGNSTALSYYKEEN